MNLAEAVAEHSLTPSPEAPEKKAKKKPFRISNEDLDKLYQLADDKHEEILKLPLETRKYISTQKLRDLINKLKYEMKARGIWEEE